MAADDQKLRVRLVGRNGRRRYEAASKERLVTACLEPGVSVSRLALEHGVFDRSGFVLVLKRLTEDRFRWPRRQEAIVTLTTEQLHWILDGIDIDAMVRHPVRQYQVAGWSSRS